MAILSQGVQTLNFVCVGQVRAGTSIVQSSISDHPRAVCHADLFHPDNNVRKKSHQAYFGRSRNADKLPNWFVPGVSPNQYIRHTIFDNPLHGESVVGFRVHYPQIVGWDLCDIFDACCREGDFGIVHVTRNPVACFVSLKQAEVSNVWYRSTDDSPLSSSPAPISLDPAELTAFVRNHEAVHRKVNAACDYGVEVTYKELLTDYTNAMRRVFRCLEIDGEVPVRPSSRRLRNRLMRQRILNLDALKRTCPSDVRVWLNAEDLV